MRFDRIKLRSEMAKRDMTQLQLAEKAGLSRSTINSIIGGKRCADKTGIKICKALNVKPEQLQ